MKNLGLLLAMAAALGPKLKTAEPVERFKQEPSSYKGGRAARTERRKKERAERKAK